MDPNTGRIYPDLNAAKLDGVANPVLIDGRAEDIERISAAVRSAWSREQKTARNVKKKAAKAARRRGR